MGKLSRSMRAKEMMMVGTMAFLSGLEGVVAGEGLQVEEGLSKEAEPHGEGKNGNREVWNVHGNPHGRCFDSETVKLQAMKGAVINDDDKKEPAAEIDEGLHEMGSPSRNRLDNGVHGKMGPGFDGDACAQEGHEDTDVTPEFLEPGEIVVEGVPKHYLDEGKNHDYKEGIGQYPLFEMFQPFNYFFHWRW